MKGIIFSGGGTLGSVSPLLALATELRRRGYQAECAWIGTKNGPEKAAVAEYEIPYWHIPAGKMRRYFSVSNFFDPVLILFGFIKSLFLLRKLKPGLVVSAGGFVSVPLVWAAWLRRVPILIHQQDAVAGLANKLMAPCASVISVTFERAREYFGRKAVVTGNPVRQDLAQADKARALAYFEFQPSVPVVFVLGGGTGSASINRLVMEALGELVGFCQVIHSIGAGKSKSRAEHPRYRGYEFFGREAMALAYAAADLVVARAGMSTLTELASLGKAAALIPIPASHQEQNAYELARFNACEVLRQNELDKDSFVKIMRDMLADQPLLHTLEKNIQKVMPPNANEKVLSLMLSIIK